MGLDLARVVGGARQEAGVVPSGWLDAGEATEGNKVTIRLGVGKAGGTTVGRVRTKPFYDPTGEKLRA